MIYVTSDTHGDPDRLGDKRLKRLKKYDTLIVLGDFGYLWKDRDYKKALRKISKLEFKILFLDGYYDDHGFIDGFPDVNYRGARAKEILPGKLYYIKRGEILYTDDMKILCFGGDDDLFEDVFGDRPPCREEFDRCRENLAAAGGRVDYVLTHSPSGIVQRFLNLDDGGYGGLAGFLDEVSQNIRYKKWYFGFYHKDKFVTPKVTAVYDNVYRLGE